MLFRSSFKILFVILVILTLLFIAFGCNSENPTEPNNQVPELIFVKDSLSYICGGGYTLGGINLTNINKIKITFNYYTNYSDYCAFKIYDGGPLHLGYLLDVYLKGNAKFDNTINVPELLKDFVSFASLMITQNPNLILIIKNFKIYKV